MTRGELGASKLTHVKANATFKIRQCRLGGTHLGCKCKYSYIQKYVLQLGIH